MKETVLEVMRKKLPGIKFKHNGCRELFHMKHAWRVYEGTKGKVNM